VFELQVRRVVSEQGSRSATAELQKRQESAYLLLDGPILLLMPDLVSVNIVMSQNIGDESASRHR